MLPSKWKGERWNEGEERALRNMFAGTCCRTLWRAATSFSTFLMRRGAQLAKHIGWAPLLPLARYCEFARWEDKFFEAGCVVGGRITGWT